MITRYIGRLIVFIAPLLLPLSPSSAQTVRGMIFNSRYTVNYRIFVNGVPRQACVRESNVGPTTDPHCPVEMLNSQHGQCSGGHMHVSPYHLVTTIPRVIFENDGQCILTDVDGRYSRHYITPPHAGLHVHEQEFSLNGVWQSPFLVDYFFITMDGNTDTPLVALPVDNAVYRRVGATSWHNPGYTDPQWGTHWGTPALVSSIQSLATTWANTVDECGCSECPVLRIGDMSLELGAEFDQNGDWEPPHFGHDIGKEVDVVSARAPDPNGVPADVVSESYFCVFAQGAGFSTTCLERNPSDPPPPAACLDQAGCLVSSTQQWHLEIP